jgi:transposase-like protein
MNPEQVFCPNVECPARGQVNKGNISVHSHQEKRYRCDVCGTTFSANKGTLFYRLKTDPKTVMLVLVLLAHGCPLPAIVAAFGFDERTVKSWWQKAGEHSEKVHRHQVGQSQLDLGQVQADEIKVKTQQGTIWMALAIMVSTRLWLGGVISKRRDKALIRALVGQIRQIALCRPLLIAVDGLASYVKAFQEAFRTKLPRYGQTGRAKLRAWPELHIVQVIKKRSANSFSVTRRVVQGSAEQIASLLSLTQGGGKINTAYIERLNATFRQHLSYLARRTRHLAQKPETLKAGMFFVGCMYNFCTYHQSLRLPLLLPDGSTRWLKRTPAIAAGLTDHLWSVEELLNFKVPPPHWTPPKQRGRPSNETLALIKQWAS